jgi:hypothetical protein
MVSGSGSGAGDMASADVATAEAATLINNLIIVSSHVIQDAIESEGWNLSRSYREIIAKAAPTQAGASVSFANGFFSHSTLLEPVQWSLP